MQLYSCQWMNEWICLLGPCNFTNVNYKQTTQNQKSWSQVQFNFNFIDLFFKVKFYSKGILIIVVNQPNQHIFSY